MSSRARMMVILLTLAVGTMAMPATSSAQPVAYGGGCETIAGVRPCIAATGSSMPLTISADFYLTSFDWADSAGFADFYVCVGIACYYEYTVQTSYLGHYPVAQEPTNNGSGNGNSEVDIFDSSLTYQGTAISPTQYWVPN